MSSIPVGDLSRAGGLFASRSGQEAPPETIGGYLRRNRWALLALAAVFLALFHSTITGLVEFCLAEEDFSYCLLIPLISGGLIVARRKEVLALPAGRSNLGLAVLLLSLALFAVGYVRAQHTFQRAGMFGSLAGLAVFLLGPALLRAQPFALLYLVLAVPIPASLYQEVSLHLRRFATSFSAGLLHACGTPVFNSGNVLHVDGEAMNVADACSGIRSLMAILAIALLCAHLFQAGAVKGVLLVLCGVPVAILVNILRIFLTGFLLHRFGIDLREGPIHDSMGLLTFSVSLVLLYLSWVFLRWLLRPAPGAREVRTP